MASETSIKRPSPLAATKEPDFRIHNIPSESGILKNERVRTIDNQALRKSVRAPHQTNQSNLFILKTKNSRASSRIDSRGQCLKLQSETTQDTESFLAKYHRFVGFAPPAEEDPPRILKKDTNFLDSLSGYEKVESLGKGAYAKVYHVRHKKTRQDFALKIYPKSYLVKPHRVTNIRSEVFLLSNLRHPNIVPLLHVYESDDNVEAPHADLPAHGEEQLRLARRLRPKQTRQTRRGERSRPHPQADLRRAQVPARHGHLAPRH